MWALGDYHRFAKELIWSFGPVLVEACGITPGQRVLDVAAGTGNVAIRAAEAGADVVALDITPESLAAGRREAESRGVELEWVEGDAQALPFGQDEFDVVTSSAGAMFAPDHQAVADEMVRVCRPGGTIGLITFVPAGLGAELFELFGRYAPPPAPGEQPPILWGDEAHVRELFGDRVPSLELTQKQYVDLWACHRHLREPCRPARGGGSARSRVPRPGDPLEPRHARGGGVPLRLLAGDRSVVTSITRLTVPLAAS
jgi:SAM-dependent methyltransferase